MLRKIIIIFLIPVGLFSQNKYELDCNRLLLIKSIEIGLQQVGTLESNNKNDGEVEKYLKSVNLSAGNPYCAAGQYYCFQQAALQLKLPIASIPIPPTGLANLIFNYGKSKGKQIDYQAAIHDLIIWRRGNTPFGHIERVVEVLDKGNVRTLAFNTSNKTGQQGVFIQNRNIYNPIRRLKIRGLIGFRGI